MHFKAGGSLRPANQRGKPVGGEGFKRRQIASPSGRWTGQGSEGGGGAEGAPFGGSPSPRVEAARASVGCGPAPRASRCFPAPGLWAQPHDLSLQVEGGEPGRTATADLRPTGWRPPAGGEAGSADFKRGRVCKVGYSFGEEGEGSRPLSSAMKAMDVSPENAHMHIYEPAYYWGFTWLGSREISQRCGAGGRGGSSGDILGNFPQILLMTLYPFIMIIENFQTHTKVELHNEPIGLCRRA